MNYILNKIIGPYIRNAVKTFLKENAFYLIIMFLVFVIGAGGLIVMAIYKSKFKKFKAKFVKFGNNPLQKVLGEKKSHKYDKYKVDFD